MVGIYLRVCITRVGMVGIPQGVYTRGGMVGILPGVYPGYTPPLPTLVYIPPYPPWYTPCTPGYTTIRTAPAGYLSLQYPTSCCAEMEPWAQGRGIPWVRGSREVKVLKCVMGERLLCAELLRSSR